MPGIFGVITDRPSEIVKQELELMRATLMHENFYVSGTWNDESLGVYVGWVARSNTFAAEMPVVSEKGDVVLIFGGEDYPDPNFVTRFRKTRPQVSGGDASYLLGLSEQNDDFPANLNGRFQGLLVDRISGKATLFNDRFGMHRVYYAESKDSFHFSSEAKAMLRIRPELRTLDAVALGEWASCGCVLENKTLFRGVGVLPGGSAWEFQNRKLTRQRTYFEPREWEQQAELDNESYYRELRNVLSDRLPRYFGGRERIAISLTGGLDTRIIMAWRRPQPGTLPSYTYGGMFRECHDVRIARQIATSCKQPHESIIVGRDFLEHFSSFAERSVYLTDGCVDLSRSPDLYVSQKAREVAPARMVGTFGSEFLQQVPAFKPVKPLDRLYADSLNSFISQAETTYATLRQQHPATFSAFTQSGCWHYGVVALEQSQLTERTPFMDNEFVRTVFTAPKWAALTNDIRQRLINEGNPALATIPTDRGVTGNAGGFRHALTRAIYEFTFKAEYAYDYGMPQWVAQIDHMVAFAHFERLFLGRHKLFHFRLWYQNHLAKYVKEMLLDRRTLARPFWNKKAVETIVSGHLSGKRNYTTEIHKLMTLELIHRTLVD